MFIGEYQHTVDGKGRLAIPVKFRKELTKGAVVTRGLDHCLFVYSVNEWKVLAEKLAALPLTQANARAFARLMLAGAMEVDVDKQGRILLPDYLRMYAKIRKESVVVGLFNRIEVWNRSAWEKYKTQTEKDSDTIAERMSDLGI